MTTEPAVDETRRLRAVVARLTQMADYWEQKLPEVIRTPAVVSAIRAALEPAVSVVPPATNQAAEARDRIAQVLADADGWRWVEGFKEQSPTWQRYQQTADAVLAVLPAPADRAAVLREAADELDAHATQLAAVSDDPAAPVAKVGIRAATEWRVAANLLRRMAVEAEQADAQRVAPVSSFARVWDAVQARRERVRQSGAEMVQAAETPDAPAVVAQPGKENGRGCGCPHPADEHSVYGCFDGCGCEWMPKRAAKGA